MMATVIWADGRKMHASSWTELLQDVNDLPWNCDLDEDEVRKQLAKRARVWSGRWLVNQYATPADLFMQLEMAGMLQITEGRPKARIEDLL